MNKCSLIPLFAVAVLLSGCQFLGSKQQEIKVEKIPVRTTPVIIEEIPQTYEFSATVEANVINNIAPQMSVRIQQIFVEVGDFVSKGQKLVQMDDNNLEQIRTQLDNMEVSFQRIDELYKVGGVSRAEWDAQKTNLEVMRTQYNNLVENTQLVSPIVGVVTARNYDSGDLYGMGLPLLVVEQISPVKLIIHVSESFFTKVRKGMDVDVALDVYPGEVFKGKVSLVYPTITAATRTFPVEILIPNNNRKVRPACLPGLPLILDQNRVCWFPTEVLSNNRDQANVTYTSTRKAKRNSGSLNWAEGLILTMNACPDWKKENALFPQV
jgi:RND family efflux transporter MFP subunit